MTDRSYDVVVVGGGHAGVEAAAVAARMGARTALLTQRLDTIGVMSCNPAIGGIGKGHLVREIDALDGIMGRAADLAAIQFRVLNKSKGPAVQGPRVQTDRKLYAEAVKLLLSRTSGLHLLQGECARILLSRKRVSGLLTASGTQYRCGAIVLTMGTFLNGVIHRGAERTPAGRFGDLPSTELPAQLAEMGFALARLKTGTPPRLDGKTINTIGLEPQWGDETPQYLSSMTATTSAPQTLCYITRTTPRSHRIVQDNIMRAASYGGAISGSGPRYCPSIEDKILRFADRDSHQVFLEPEGLEDDSIYPNGISTSLPANIQTALVNSIPGLERARITRPGYAIEYDYINPTQLEPTLMSQKIAGLFLAGQINGTTGYEEAASQGMAAGINAALFTGTSKSQIFSRTNSYLGVLIDDLISFGVTEPYRMFTSRAEHRLSLRADNAEERLTPLGIELSAVGKARRDQFSQTNRKLENARLLLRETTFSSTQLAEIGISTSSANTRKTAFEWAATSTVSLPVLLRLSPALNEIDATLLPRLDADAKYNFYIERQQRDVERQKAYETLKIPAELDFDSLSGLSAELKAKFRKNRPQTIAQAGRFEGVTPAALLLLTAKVKRIQKSARY